MLTSDWLIRIDEDTETEEGARGVEVSGAVEGRGDEIEETEEDSPGDGERS